MIRCLYSFARFILNQGSKKPNFLFCLIIDLYIVFLQAPEAVEEKRHMMKHLYYIAHREPASLKTFQSHLVPWKEKSASENSRVFLLHCMFTAVLYFVSSVEP